AHVIVAPALVQGPGAPASLRRALAAVAARVDVVIVARGGGSLEDLWCFNDEGLARAVAACRVPGVSALGHGTDVTIGEFVGSGRDAPAPGACRHGRAASSLAESGRDLATWVRDRGTGGWARGRPCRGGRGGRGPRGPLPGRSDPCARE